MAGEESMLKLLLSFGDITRSGYGPVCRTSIRECCGEKYSRLVKAGSREFEDFFLEVRISEPAH
jgi:hypothetical protein